MLQLVQSARRVRTRGWRSRKLDKNRLKDFGFLATCLSLGLDKFFYFSSHVSLLGLFLALTCSSFPYKIDIISSRNITLCRLLFLPFGITCPFSFDLPFSRL